MIPGEYILCDREIMANAGRQTLKLKVSNIGDRPIQVGSHFHFFEVNRALVFNRDRAFGLRLGIPAGTAIRFEPGEEKEITLVELSGEKCVYGLNGLTEGATTDPAVKDHALKKLTEKGFWGDGE